MTNEFGRIAADKESADFDIQTSNIHRDEPSEDSVQTPREVKDIVQTLLKTGRVDETEKPELFRRAMARENDIVLALEPLDLSFRLDTHRGLAFLVISESAYHTQDDTDTWSHPLVRRQRLTLEQSLLLAILRQIFVLHETEMGIGLTPPKIPIDELLPQYLVYFGDSGSDTQDRNRLENLLEQLKVHGVVSEIDEQEEVTIRPMIVHLANPESLTELLKVMKKNAAQNEETDEECR